MTTPHVDGQAGAIVLQKEDYSYYEIINHILTCGDVVESRYGRTFELTGVEFHLPMGAIVRRKKFNRKLAFMEFLQIVAGVFDPDKLVAVAPKADHSLFTPQMAYGPRLKTRLPAAVKYLKKDRDGRQAVLFVGTPSDGMTANLPCTVALHALVRCGTLQLSGMMRSWDSVKGLPTDMLCFGGIGLLLAHALGVEHGTVKMFAGSLHLYIDDYLGVKRRFPEIGIDRFSIDPTLVPTTWDGIVEWAGWAMDISHWKNGVPPGIVYTKGQVDDEHGDVHAFDTLFEHAMVAVSGEKCGG